MTLKVLWPRPLMMRCIDAKSAQMKHKRDKNKIISKH